MSPVAYLTTVLLWGIHLHRSASGQCAQYSKPNTALVNSAYKTVDVANLGECNVKCDEDEKCLSVNYWKLENKCDLNNATKTMYPEKVKGDRNAIYANIREGIKGPKNCADVLKFGGKSNGVYTIHPEGEFDAFKVYCDQTTDGGGWTVFQRRQDGSVDFYLGWADYKQGFGNETGEFWLGLDKIHLLTHQTENTSLRVEMTNSDMATKHAKYSYFAVSDEDNKYTLRLGSYSGDAGDAMKNHHGRPFSTKDRDNDANSGNCAVTYHAAWWFISCFDSSLNGPYHPHSGHGIAWNAWTVNLKYSEMKMRPVNFPGSQ